MSFLDHPSLPRKPKLHPFSKPGKELILKAPALDEKIPKEYHRKWKAGNEERMLNALERFGHLQMRVKFELLEEDEEKRVKYKTLAGRTLVFKKIATQGSLLGIVKTLTQAGVEEAKKWTKKRNTQATTIS